jgi:tetratricopeptide (TPR) repeat protein
MLKFTHLFNFSLAGALIVPSIKQQMDSPKRIEQSIRATESSLDSLKTLEARLASGEYEAVQGVLDATEAPFGGARERDALLDRLRDEIGALNAQVELIDGQSPLPHLQVDPSTSVTQAELDRAPTVVPTTGLDESGRNELGNIWPPVVGGAPAPIRSEDDRYSFEPKGFTVDAVLQGRAYYRAGRYKEALTLLRSRVGDPSADYWIGRTYERLGQAREAKASYTAVMNNPESNPIIAERAKRDAEFLEWLVDFDRKVKDLRGPDGGAK